MKKYTRQFAWALAALTVVGLTVRPAPARAATVFSIWADLNDKSETGIPFTPLFPMLIGLGASAASGFFGGPSGGPVVWGLVILDGDANATLPELQKRLSAERNCTETESREAARVFFNAMIRQKREGSPQVVSVEAIRKAAPHCADSIIGAADPSTPTYSSSAAQE